MALAPAFQAQSKANANFQSSMSSLCHSSDNAANFVEKLVQKLTDKIPQSDTLNVINNALVDQGRKSHIIQSTPSQEANVSSTPKQEPSPSSVPKLSL